MTAIDYASFYETRIRPRRRILARVVWAALFLVRPRLAISIWRERRG